MPNMKRLISNHNKRVLNQQPIDQTTNYCNCRDKSKCPLVGACLSSSIVYSAKVTTVSHNDPTIMTYIGMTGGDFKARFNNHKKSFHNETYKKETELSKYIWSWKESNTSFNIQWNILNRIPTRMTAHGQCNLCTEEKLAILSADKASLLNKRSENVSKCRHRNRPSQP
ncbi:hypothetical protein HOLleu_22096 [Holothuria leucospilota]|uniref:GIY-YIG domain-containing protein n=1 Tax=Holothuria leucospilota TaxID=206669 RepID=A0A9Q1BY28_HOLLE|nr:hypothetical protein HOLleu_22096 [Holothuria leucospilota]